MARLITLPHEVLHNTLKEVDPVDLASLSRCCKPLRGFIAGNRTLFKDVFVHYLDEPPGITKSVEYDWEGDLQRFVKLRSVVTKTQVEIKMHLRFIAQTVTGLLKTAKPGSDSLNVALLTNLLKEREVQEMLFCQSEVFDRAKGIPQYLASTAEERNLSAKLHCLYGVPITACGRTRSSQTYPYAVSKVYDLRNYTDATMWGPFLGDGSGNVDWEKMEAILLVLAHNLRMFSDSTNGLFKPIWSQPFVDAVPDSYVSLPIFKTREIVPPANALDPYNVSGSWMRVVCFLDFHELFNYNFTTDVPDDQPRPPLDTTEAIRAIVMEIRVTKIVPPGKHDGQSLPVVHFKGTSRSLHTSWDPNANALLKGSVRLTPEGEIRWTTFSIYGNEVRWRSEGIQVGGIRSARGVLGNWFDKDFDRHGPAGPTAFWKISDDVDHNLDPNYDHEADNGEDEDNEDNDDDDDDADVHVFHVVTL